MKKAIFMALTVILTGCSSKYTPDFVLKYTDPIEYHQRMAAKSCKIYQQNRVIQIDGVSGFYDYNGNDGFDCFISNKEVLQPYQNPSRHANHRDDIYPIGRTN